MSSVVDQYSDPSFGFLVRQVKAMPAIEPFVKNASIEAGDTDNLPDTAFAWPSQRKYPIHTPEQATLSYAYSKLASAIPAEVETNLKTALEVYGVSLDIFNTATTEKVAALEDDAYLLPEMKLFPVTDAASVKYAEQRVLSQITKLSLENRATVCGNLVKKADHFKVNLHPEVLKLAGFVVSSTAQVRDWLSARAEALPVEKHLYKAAYEALAEGLKGLPAESRDRPGLLKLASAIAELDEQAGLDKHYDRKLPDPLQTVFNTRKVASEMVDLNGTMVPLSKLAALPATFWEDLGGRELSDELCPGGKMDNSKLAMIVDTLPLDLKVILRAQLRA
jgi:hypothetical protein